MTSNAWSGAMRWRCGSFRYVHRDLKPDNVLFASPSDPGSSLRLADFGTAAMVDGGMGGGVGGSGSNGASGGSGVGHRASMLRGIVSAGNGDGHGSSAAASQELGSGGSSGDGGMGGGGEGLVDAVDPSGIAGFSPMYATFFFPSTKRWIAGPQWCALFVKDVAVVYINFLARSPYFTFQGFPTKNKLNDFYCCCCCCCSLASMICCCCCCCCCCSVASMICFVVQCFGICQKVCAPRGDGRQRTDGGGGQAL